VDDRLATAGVQGVSFDLFGTLVTVEKPPDPGAAVGDALRARDVDLPPDWDDAYRTAYVDADPLEEIPLQHHVHALFESHAADVDSTVDSVPSPALIDEALLEAFETPIQTREGAVETVEALADHVPVGILSNSSVEGLVDRALERSAIPLDALTVIRSSVAIGWRKPHEQSFKQIANDLQVELEGLVHVGDDPRTDGGADRVGARAAILPEAGPLTIDAILEAI
jgi:HAD superfamily hydrolase (TIGR01549 family)